MKRIIYIVLSFITLFSGFYGSYLLAFHSSKSPLGIEILLFFLSLILQLASCFLFNMIFGLFYLITEGIDNPIFGLYSIFFGFLTRKMKKIYYSDLGYFYASYGSDDVMIFRQDILALKYLFTCEYDGDINSLNRSIESNLKKIYGEKLREKRKRDTFKNWDGYIDTSSKRDDKIKKILQ